MKNKDDLGVNYLEKYINASHWFTRARVARYGYGLDILINDDYIIVKSVAKETRDTGKFWDLSE